MAETPRPELKFVSGCNDCAVREVDLPKPLPLVGDDFDWAVRDYDSFRVFMLEELTSRFPERTRWTPADMEVMLVELFSGALDQLSDMIDRVFGEAFLETARRPESVRRLLSMIGYDAVSESSLDYNRNILEEVRQAEASLDRLWLNQPKLMEEARQKGPANIQTQYRMVTEKDYAENLERHPFVQRSCSWTRWGGSWPVINIGLVLQENQQLDEYPGQTGLWDAAVLSALKKQTDTFHSKLGLKSVNWEDRPSIRAVLKSYIEDYRMAGQDVVIQNAELVGIYISLSVSIVSGYYQSEVRNSILEALGTGSDGFFKPGRLAFGEDLYVSDIFQTVMNSKGVTTVCVNRFKRMGNAFQDQSGSGRIKLSGLEIAVCNNDHTYHDSGYILLNLNGGIKG